jgi:hypothetical protein
MRAAQMGEIIDRQKRSYFQMANVGARAPDASGFPGARRREAVASGAAGQLLLGDLALLLECPEQGVQDGLAHAGGVGELARARSRAFGECRQRGGDRCAREPASSPGALPKAAAESPAPTPSARDPGRQGPSARPRGGRTRARRARARSRVRGSASGSGPAKARPSVSRSTVGAGAYRRSATGQSIVAFPAFSLNR